MPVEETFLDPPITPAPVFAYRAIRGWFIGSPDSSPERDNKENIYLAKSGTPSKHAHNIEDAIKLSPQKRKLDSLNLASPTKSILRTPGGAPTPRAKSLRDVNVKFKSLSPDVQRKVAAVSIEQKSESVKVVVNDVPQQDGAREKPEDCDVFQTVAAMPDADLETHFRRTEKEMKRLIRRGHKWKETARRFDEENRRLKFLLDEAQKQNQRLESALRKTQGDQKFQHGAEQGAALSARGQGASSFRVPKVGSRRVNTDREMANSSTGKKSTTPAIEELLDLTPPAPVVIEAPMRPTILPPSSSHHPLAKARPASLQHQSQTSQPKTTLPQRPASISTLSPLTALQHRIEGSILPVAETAARTNIAPDKISAVRKRLMAKNAARLAGLSVLDGVGAAPSEAVGLNVKSKVNEDESGVDWVGV